MKREILFRGKRKDNKEWVYGYYLAQNGRGIDGSKDTEIHQIMESGSTQIVDPETVGQYTGIKDINGVKIFEGDLVEYEDEIFEVCWHSKWAEFGFVGANSLSWYLQKYFEIPFEVTGNIHDHPKYQDSK